jgi:hypothetical protein
LDAGRYIKSLANILNRKYTKTPVSVTHGITHIYEYNVKITSSLLLVGYYTKRDTRQLVTIKRWDP